MARSLEETPTWAVSVFALIFFFLSFLIDTILHLLTKFLNRGRRKSLNRALMKFKTEMMKLGLMSLLLTISEEPISQICVGQAVANTFLLCKYPVNSLDVEPSVSSATQVPRSNSTNRSKEVNDQNYCEAKGMVPLLPRAGVLQLNILISLVTVFHVLYCILTMFLGMAKMGKWNAWENETRTLEYQILNDSRRFQLIHQTPFGKRHLKFWSKHPLLLWPVCFARQFCGSISKTDYMTLRNGFIRANFADGNNFNFLRFLARAFDDDFEQVVGIRFWIWLFSILFIFLSSHVFYDHYWLPFIPLLIVIVVGAKLEVIITKMCVESCKNTSVVRGRVLVQLNDDLFWFGRPRWLLHLIQLVLIQNSFHLAFLTWTWFESGSGSCLNRKSEIIAIRITMGVVVQLICGYVTLPLHVLVTQMGSGMRRAVFTESVVEGLQNWHKKARHSLSKSRSISRSHSHSSSHLAHNFDTTEVSISDKIVKEAPDSDQRFPPLVAISSSSTSEITEEEVPQKAPPTPYITSLSVIPEITKEEENPKIVASTVTYDGEISFGSSWKFESSERHGREITEVIDEDHDSEILATFDQQPTTST
ncbi:hypothetical protein ACFX2I_011958 [Malus domestica]